MRIDRVTRQTYAAGVEQRTHEHDHAVISIVLRGALTETVEGRETLVTVGDVLVKPRGIPHANRYTEGATVGSLVLADDAHGYAVNRGSAASLIARILHARFAGLPVEDEVVDLEAALEGTAGFPSWPNSRMAEIAHLLATTSLSIGDIAHVSGMHRVAMARSFRRAYGSSLTHFRLRARARRAASLLSGSKLPISDIALDAGFADQSHLCRVFRSELGVTPRAFRRLAS